MEVATSHEAPPILPHEGPMRTDRATRWCLFAFYADAAICGVLGAATREPTLSSLLMGILLAIALSWWAVIDSRRRGHPIPLFSRPWFFIFAGILVPIYIIWSRGWRGVGWLLLHLALWFMVVTAVGTLVSAIVPTGG